MSVRPIVITGDPTLHTPAHEVTAFDTDLRNLVRDMEDTMAAAPGVGLAAPQIGVPLRVFIWSWTDENDVEHRGTVVNPVLWISPPPVGEPDENEELEGCLSIPGERFPLRRAEHAILTGVDEAGSPLNVRASGWLARIFQHEFDHLNGVLYADRLEYVYAKAAARAVRKNGWGVAGASWLPGVDDLDA
ncbi:MAG TPA: peptide deformylase [Pseudolysinimonas sp.]|nr:peptide deformylase [Pseudolysinimonas sp.]